MNNCVIKTSDGKSVEVEFNEKKYIFSIEALSIDSSELIKDISNSGLIEEIIIDNSDICDFKEINEMTDEFIELVTFIENIFKSYNKALEELNTLELEQLE